MTINDVPLKMLTFQIGQIKWDGWSSKNKLNSKIKWIFAKPTLMYTNLSP